MEQSTADFSISISKQETDSTKQTTTNLKLYGNPVFIYDEINNRYLSYTPNKHPITEKYAIEETLYECVIVPTRVFIGKDISTGVLVAIKEINKSKISNSMLLEFIYNESTIGKYFSNFCNSVVQVYDYYENEKSICIVMELCDRPNFFEELLENVSYNLNINRDTVLLRMKKY